MLDHRPQSDAGEPAHDPPLSRNARKTIAVSGANRLMLRGLYHLVVTDFVSATADIRGDYRYSLTRVWDTTQLTITFVLLNPSTADAVDLDPTLRRCVNFAKRDGFGSMMILNLYAYRTPSPAVMLAASDPVGPENDRVLANATGTVVAGWGTNASPTRVAHALKLLPPLKALKITKNGHPQHPLYVKGDSPLVDWPSPSAP